MAPLQPVFSRAESTRPTVLTSVLTIWAARAQQSLCVLEVAWVGDLLIPRSDHSDQRAFFLLVEGKAGPEMCGV